MSFKNSILDFNVVFQEIDKSSCTQAAFELGIKKLLIQIKLLIQRRKNKVNKKCFNILIICYLV